MIHNKVFPVEGEEKNAGENEHLETQVVQGNGSVSNGLPPQLSLEVEFSQLSASTSTVCSQGQDSSYDVLQNENDSRVQNRNRTFSGALKRRDSNMVNYEKMLKEMNANSSETLVKKRQDNECAECILEYINEVNEENRGEQGEIGQSDNGEDQSENQANGNETDGLKKSEDSNQALLQYFGKLSSSNDCDDCLNLEHIKSLLSEGASVNTSDRFGQTLLHEVSRTWGIDVAQFFVEQGADINKADDYGRTPLHVAASSDYPEMVRFLIENGADFQATTKGELQTPLHFAARNEASQCIKILLAYGATLEVRDYKQRTPLQLAAETNSAECARILLEAGASAGTRDDSGMAALTLMVTKMPSVALRALDQFHIKDRSHRKQRYYLNFLENCDPPNSKKHSVTTSPLLATVEMNCFELIMHPIFQRLIEVKWGFFGSRAWLGIFLNVLLTVAYTVLGLLHPNDVADYYYPLSSNSWRIPLEAIVVVLTFNEIRKEVKEFYQSRKENKTFIGWRKKEIKRDLQFCHPRWSQEKKVIKQHVKQIKERERFYFQDRWNYFDWVTYVMLIIVIILHVINVTVQNNNYNDIFIRILACSIILVWVRLLKFARPFPSLGPFVVILDSILGDTIRWGFVFMMFYIPYAVAFWMIFGGRTKTPVKGYDNVFHMLYTMIRFPLVDNYGFERLEDVAPYMSRVLCGSFLLIAAIVLMNLYIALLSNTFQRVFDNARATAAMQRARLLQDLESNASDKTVRRYREFIRDRCSPEGNDLLVVISDEEDQKRQQKEKIALVHTIVSHRLGGKKFGKVQKSEFDTIIEDIGLLKRTQSEMEKSVERLHLRLEEIGSLNAVIYQEIAKLLQGGKEQRSAISGVSEQVTDLKNNITEKFGSLESSLDSKIETLETEEKLRNDVLESNMNSRFDQLEMEFKTFSSYCNEYHQACQEMTVRIDELEAYVVSVEEDKIKEKQERKPSPKPRSKSAKGGFQIVEANRDVLKAAAMSTSKSAIDATSLSLSKSPEPAADAGSVHEFGEREDECIVKQRKRTIALSGQAARNEYIARLKESIVTNAEQSDTEKDKREWDLETTGVK